MAAIIDSLRRTYRFGSMAVRLVFINVGVFLLLRIASLVLTLCGADVQSSILQWIELPSDIYVLATRPWTIFTYMFAQYDVFHLLFNVLWLYWFGALFLYCSTPRQLVALYVYGGLGGAALYLIAFAILPYFHGSFGWLIGSSASVLAIVVATAWRMPDYKVGLLFIGDVSLKWIAAVTVLISLLSIPGENAGGNIAHIGGALMGMWYGMAMNGGRDITAPFSAMCDRMVNLFHRIGDLSFHAKKRQDVRPNASYKKNTPATDEAELDIILDKIKKSGYSALTAEERKRLFDVSRRMK